MMKTIKVSEKGQIAIPNQMREEMGIERGDELLIMQVDGKILIEKMQRAEQKLQDDFKDIVKLSEKALKKVWDNKSDEVWNKYLKRK